MEPLTSTTFRRALAFIFTLALIASLAFQGTRGLYETTEGRYAECARQTFERGILDEPYLNGEHHWTKPPLTYWAIGLGLEVFGTNTWGARAYLVFAYLAAVAAVYGAGAMLWGDRRAGLASALVFATSPFVVGGAWSVSTDMLVLLWQALAVCFFLAARRRNSRACMLLMWGALGLAFLTKGPPAMLCLIGIATLAWIERRDPVPRPALLHPLGLALFIVIALPWYVYENYKYPGLLRYWIMDETIARNLRDQYQRNPSFYEGLLMYLPIMLVGALPWTALVLAWAGRIPWPWGMWSRPLRWMHGRQWTFLMVSTLAPLALFMLSKSKLPLYVLPLFVPIALALGKGLIWLLEQRLVRVRTLAMTGSLLVICFVSIKAASGLVEMKKDMKQVKHLIEPIMAAHPDYGLYTTYRAGLNGLQFYLQEELPMIDDDDLRDLLKQRSEAGQGTLLLIREHNREDKPYSKLIDRGDLRQEALNKEWVLLSNAPKADAVKPTANP